MKTRGKRFGWTPVALAVLWSVPAAAEIRPDELEGQGFHWKAAFAQSGAFLAIQHGFRFATEEGTRQDLRGPFVRDYLRSFKGVRGWRDGDPFIVNYVGHPMMGAVTGFIQIQNDPRGRAQVFGSSPDYWRSRARAFAWSAFYSLQFELGPLSEASLGNVGRAPGTAGVVDLVVTPVGGIGFVAIEDALDRYVIHKLERKTSNRPLRAFLRCMLNPDRSFANLMRFKPPWHRDQRPGISE